MLSTESRADDRVMALATDMTRAGRKLVPPTAEHPTYYVPVFLGYNERGEQGQHFMRRPNEGELKRALVAALAKQHYLVVSRNFQPTLTITFEWGTVSPVFDRRRVLNQGEIRTIVLGESKWDVPAFGSTSDQLLSLTARHYLVISAFAYQRSADKEDVLLWRAHSTTDLWGNYLEDVMKPLIANISLGLGRAVKPGLTWKDERTGVVTIGTPEVVHEPDPNQRKAK